MHNIKVNVLKGIDVFRIVNAYGNDVRLTKLHKLCNLVGLVTTFEFKIKNRRYFSVSKASIYWFYRSF